MPGCAFVMTLRMDGIAYGASASLVILGKRAEISRLKVPNVARNECTEGPRRWAMAKSLSVRPSSPVVIEAVMTRIEPCSLAHSRSSSLRGKSDVPVLMLKRECVL